MRGSGFACRSIVAASVGLSLLAPGCRAPTQLTVALTTDVKCSEMHRTSMTAGRLGDIESTPLTTSSTFCSDSGDLGTLVVVPSGGRTDEVALKVILGRGRDAESCVAPTYGPGCIVARRAIRYIAHAGLR